MDKEIEVETIEINNNEYFLVDTLEIDKEIYRFFANIDNQKDVQVLKDKKIDNEDYFCSIENEDELSKVLREFYLKYKKEL